ncbi:MAG: hypothetical protein NBV67_05940, partial [Tagaea sp.]|nr:hypothetical protein [Tagaea sp.]
GETPDPIRALACVPLDAKVFAARWRLSNAEAARLARLRAPKIELAVEADARSLRRAFYALGADTIDRALLDGARSSDAALYEMAKDWRRPVLPVTGDDLRARGIAPGPELGRLLDEIETRWIASDFRLAKEKLLVEAGFPRVL